MAAPTPNIQSILDALKVVQPNSTAYPASTLSAPTASGAYPIPPASYSTPPGAAPYAPPAQYPSHPPAYPYPAPSASGSVDLSTIRPNASGTVSIEQAIAQAKSYAAEQGVTPYDRQAAYPPNDRDGRSYRRSRSRSPNGRFRDNFQGYRDERRDHGGQNRGFQRDRSLSPGPRHSDFSTRAGGHHGRERSPLRGGDENSEIMEIESNLVGLIIGRQGENLRRVEGESRARVQFLPSTEPTQPFRLCKISGAPPRRAEARAAITKIIQDSGLSAGGGGGGGGGRGGRGNTGGRITDNPPPVPQEGEATLKIMVPDRTVGLIIGRGGETIRDLQERSRCHINIVSESKSVNGLRPVNLIGSPEAAKMAKDLILEIVDSDSRNGNNPGNVGNNAPPSRMDARGGGGGGGAGHDKINDSMYVPSEAVGMIIGKGGETIREMQNNTGCKINVSQTGDIEREIGLVGSRDAINRAKQAIQEKVDAVKQKSGGGGGGRGRHRDFDNPGYSQNSNQYSAPQNTPQAGNGTAGAPAGADDPYAAYGGYAAWAAMWMQALSAQQQAGQGGPPPGTS